MNLRFLRLTIMGLVVILIGTACASQAPATPTPTVETMSTMVARIAAAMLTGTAAAASPTPTLTLTPKETATPIYTSTPTSVPRPPLVVNFAGCWRGPGSNYVLVSNISKGQRVDLKGIGSVPGWYIVINPYFRQLCWIQAQNLSIHAGTDMTKYPIMTPGTPGP